MFSPPALCRSSRPQSFRRLSELLNSLLLTTAVVGCATQGTVTTNSRIPPEAPPAQRFAPRSPVEPKLCPVPAERFAESAAPDSAVRTDNASPRSDVVLASQTETAAAESRSRSRARSGGEFAERLQLPPDLPGAESAPISLPSLDDPEERARAIENLFPPLPVIPESDPATPPAGAVRYTLRDLEERTLMLAPGIDQAENAIVAAGGQAWQVGRPPNPLVGYEADTVRTNGTPGYQGIFFEQLIKTAGKLSLAREVASYNVINAELDFQKARADQLNQVRKAWFNLLVARENVRITRVLAAFSESMFQLPVDQLREEQIAPYEPLPLRALVFQARAAFEAAVARERAGWQQLAAAVGDPDLPVGEIEGTAVVELDSLEFGGLVTWLQQYHTQLQVASNLEQQARVEVEAQYRQRVPDIKVYSAIQADYTTPPVQRTAWNLQVGIPVPIFDFNRGNIQKAQAELARASRQYERVRNDLRQQLAEAWQRYESARIQVLAYRQQILPDQARAYLGFARRHAEEGSVSYIDVVVAQQNLATALSIYLTSLSDQWNAWTDLLAILQIQDVSQAPGADRIGSGTGNSTSVPPIPGSPPRDADRPALVPPAPAASAP